MRTSQRARFVGVIKPIRRSILLPCQGQQGHLNLNWKLLYCTESRIYWGISLDEGFDPASKPRPTRTLEFELIACIVTLGSERSGLRILQDKGSISEEIAISIYSFHDFVFVKNPLGSRRGLFQHQALLKIFRGVPLFPSSLDGGETI